MNNHYRVIVDYLSRKKIDTDPKAIQQIEFVEFIGICFLFL